MTVGYTTSKDTLSRNVGLSQQGPNYGINSNIPVWVRPSEWLDLPTVGDDESKVVGLVSVADADGQFLSLLAWAFSPSTSGYRSWVVDWGDGAVETYSSTGTTINHVYDFSTITSPLTSDGCKQVIVQIYPTFASEGDYLNIVNIGTKYTGTTPGTLTNYYTSGWLDVLVNCPGLTSLTVGSGGTTVSYLMKCRQFSLKRAGALGNSFNLGGMTALESVPEFNITGNTNMQYMFYNCVSLKVAPVIPWNYCTNAFNMFFNCSSLVYVPDATTNMSSSFVAPNSVTRFMFSGCSSLVRAPWLDLSKNINTQNMFNGCTSLQYVPDYDYGNCANATSMFTSCYNLETLPNFDNFGNVAVANTASMFANCYSMTNAPDIDISGSTTMNTMFSNCYSLVSVPAYNTSNVTNMGIVFNGCTSLTSLPLFDTSKVTNFTQAVPSTGLITIPAYDLANCTTLGTMYGGGGNAISKVECTGMNASFSFNNQHLSKNALETMFNNMAGNNATVRTVTITNNWGADPVVTSNLTAGQAAGSTTLTVASSASYEVGDAVFNSVCFADVTVSLNNSTDIVSRVNHGLSDGTRISFPSLGTATGFLRYTIYYVVNATTNNFQFSETLGGSPVDILTSSTTTTLRYEVFVTGKPTGTTLTISAPTTATTTATALTGRALNTYLATLKNWTITG